MVGRGLQRGCKGGGRTWTWKLGRVCRGFITVVPKPGIGHDRPDKVSMLFSILLLFMVAVTNTAAAFQLATKHTHEQQHKLKTQYRREA